AYVVVWQGETADGTYDVFTAVFNAQGEQVVAPVDVSNTPGVDDSVPDVTALANGAYALTWLATDPDPFQSDIYTAIYQFVDDVSVVASPDANINLTGYINISGNLVVNDNAAAVLIDASNLVSVGGSLTIDNNPSATAISLGALVTVSGNVDISGNTSATI